MVLERTLESPLDCKEIQSVHPKGNQSWIFIGRTDAEAETPILWPPDVKNWLIWKDPDAGKDWRWEEKGTTEDEMVGWHHWLNGHEFEQAPGVSEELGGLGCCSPWGHKESDMTVQLNWTEPNCPILCYPISIWASLPLSPLSFLHSVFKKNNNNNNWSIVDLQFCLSFRCTAKWFSWFISIIGFYKIQNIVVLHVYKGILLSHKKEWNMPFSATWMGLVIIILSEVSQRNKAKYYTIYIYIHTYTYIYIIWYLS